MITEDWALAKKKAEAFDNTTTYFTNSLDCNGLVGAVVIQQNQQERTMEKKTYIVTSNILNSYVAELYGVFLAAQKIRRIRHIKKQAWHFTVAIDCQNALHSLFAPKCQSGQYIISLILKELEKLTKLNTYISFRWVPTYKGIKSNKHAHVLNSQITEKQIVNRIMPSVAGFKRLKLALIKEGQKQI